MIKTTPELYSQLTRSSGRIHALLLQVTSKFHTLSCDEMYLQIDGAPAKPGPDGVALAVVLRQWIQREVGCTVSVGIGQSTVAARFATSRAKPPGPGVFAVPWGAAAAVLAPGPPGQLSGVGQATAARLAELGLTTCGDVALAPRGMLQRHFGADKGSALGAMARGEDPKPRELDVWALVDQRPTSLQNDMNYNVRITALPELEALLLSIVDHLVGRLDEDGLEARSVGVRLKIRKPGAAEPGKVGGYGMCDAWTKTTALGAPVWSAADVQGVCVRAVRQCGQQMDQVRGVGVVLTKLSERGGGGGGGDRRNPPRIDEMIGTQKRRAEASAGSVGPAGSARFPAPPRLFADEVDESVLAELPADIQREIVAAMSQSPRRKKGKVNPRINDFFGCKGSTGL